VGVTIHRAGRGHFTGLAGRLVAVALLAVLSGCATSSLTGRSQFMVVSESHTISGSASAYRSMLGGLSKKGKLETGTPRAQRVKEITDRLIAQAVRFRKHVKRVIHVSVETVQTLKYLQALEERG
jgi:hypothetical protein